ncbi:carbohydrate esterase family 9 protein [Dentipellis sp. KUC8613]|nr:carbohydrate esterase family 9 protein [Dentipellis sp. KUC8613]
MDKLPLPTTTTPDALPRGRTKHRRLHGFIAFCALYLFAQLYLQSGTQSAPLADLPIHAQETLARCRALNLAPGPPPDFHRRRESDRYVPGTPATLIRNARIWTGGDNGTEVVKGDLYLDGGLIRGVGRLGRFEAIIKEQEANGALNVVDAQGAWVSPGIVDSHSHLGVDSAPELDGASDTNSFKATVQPWLRSLDGLNTRDDAYALSIAGGVTTALVLPGSANAIGGQAFTIKLRKTAERSPTSLLLEPPYEINGTHGDPNAPPRWRQMKHACGENPSRVYGATRLDTFWEFRKAYDKARQIKTQQDAYCSKALSGQWASLGEFPEDLQWEALVDVLRGRVRVHTHCYEAVDLDDLVRLTNEFEFPVAAVHHAHEAYLVPDVLKRAYGHTPAAAIFATNGRYKREAYRASEFAARILSENGIKVVMKSDHPVLNSRYLLYEAQQAHYYGLPDNLALSTVTTHAAQVTGMDHRIGYIKEGYDADLIIWDSHPLALGATPSQVFIDGIAQLKSPVVVHKADAFQDVPETPDFDEEAAKTIEYEGLPPLLPSKSDADVVLFTNIKNILLPQAGRTSLAEVYTAETGELGVAVVTNGSLSCYGAQSACSDFADGVRVKVVDLRGGAISPGLLTYGSPLGLEEIAQEPSTRDGPVFDPLTGKVPKIVRDVVTRAVDGLQFAGRSALLAYRAGVTKAITAPQHRRFFAGLATSFSTGARHKLEDGAVIQEVTALHVAISHFGSPSVSTQIAALRKLLTALPEDEDDELKAAPQTAEAFKAVAQGKIPIVIETHSADVIATLILLKKEVEEKTGASFQLTIAGGNEAHLLAKELAQADIGVIIIGSRPFPATWESQRILPGPPLSQDSGITALLAHNVSVGIGVEESWSARNTRFDLGWAALESGGRISKPAALALASTNLEKLLGGEVEIEGLSELVATEGGDLLQFESKVVAVISPRRRLVDLLL